MWKKLSYFPSLSQVCWVHWICRRAIATTLIVDISDVVAVPIGNIHTWTDHFLNGVSSTQSLGGRLRILTCQSQQYTICVPHNLFLFILLCRHLAGTSRLQVCFSLILNDAVYLRIFMYIGTKTELGSVCRADQMLSNGLTLRSLANFNFELERFCCSLTATCLYMSIALFKSIKACGNNLHIFWRWPTVPKIDSESITPRHKKSYQEQLFHAWVARAT